MSMGIGGKLLGSNPGPRSKSSDFTPRSTATGRASGAKLLQIK